MWIEFNFQENSAIIRKEPNDEKVYCDSVLFYKIKIALQKIGFDCIKRLMWKDGHLVDEREHYIIDRKSKWFMWNPNYQVRSAYEDYNDGKVILRLE